MLKPLSAVVLAAIAAPAVAAQAAPEAAPIVVTGQRLQDYRDRLAACLARNCPVDEDIRASTALAEVLFFAGDYRDARDVLQKSLSRNGKQAKSYPEPVSDLYRADAKIARHLGFDKEAQRSVWEILRSLQAGIPKEDTRHFTARMELVHSLIFFGKLDEAERQLKDLAALCRKAGYPGGATLAELQAVWIQYRRGQWSPAIRQLEKFSASADRQQSIGARLLLVRIYGERGETEKADGLIRQLGTGGQKRALLFEPDYQLTLYEQNMADRRVAANSAINLTNTTTDNFDGAWIDVSYRIKADGSVDDVQILRRGKVGPGWEEPLIKAIKGRRYTASAQNLETNKIERFSYTAPMWSAPGSRLQSRSLRARVEKIELSSVDLPA